MSYLESFEGDFMKPIAFDNNMSKDFSKLFNCCQQYKTFIWIFDISKTIQ